MSLSRSRRQRGVWQADFFGPDGELVLLAISRQNRLVAPIEIVPHGGSRVDAANKLQDILDTADPVPDIRIV